MDNAYHSSSRRRQPAGIPPPSPRLLRSKSGTPPSTSQSLIHPSPSNHSSAVHRSKSTTKSRTKEEDQENSISINNHQMKVHRSKDNIGYIKFWQNNKTSTTTATAATAAKRTRATPNSPSAWALSPGRSSPVTPMAKSGGGGRVSGVLKYFRQRKVVGGWVQEVEYGEFRVNYNRLLQWRFVNARAEASVAAVNILAQKKLFNVWVRILLVRNSIMEMRIEIQRLKNEIKLYKIINSQASLLKEWGKLEGRNCEAVGRVVRKLSATSIRVPLLHGAKADAEGIYDAMSEASMVMANIEETIMQFHSQVERTCYLLTELTIIGKQQKEYLEEMGNRIAMVATFKAVEKSLRAHLIQLLMESRRIEGP